MPRCGSKRSLHRSCTKRDEDGISTAPVIAASTAARIAPERYERAALAEVLEKWRNDGITSFSIPASRLALRSIGVVHRPGVATLAWDHAGRQILG